MIEKIELVNDKNLLIIYNQKKKKKKKKKKRNFIIHQSLFLNQIDRCGSKNKVKDIINQPYHFFNLKNITIIII